MANGPLRHFDPWSLVVIVVTLVLFLLALVVKGITHELFLEAGVFLVSVKLILMSYKNGVAVEQTDAHLQQIQVLLRAIEERTAGPKLPAA
jgi:hypothetical protein